MKETEFYDICDSAESITEDITNSYFPSIQEMEDHINVYGLEDQICMLAYFASNPFKRQDNMLKDNPDYLSLVKYAKKRLGEIELTE